MKTPDLEIREQLYANVALHFERAARIVLESRVKPVAKMETIRGLLKTAYQSGLDRGYDLGYHVFGDGADDE